MRSLLLSLVFILSSTQAGAFDVDRSKESKIYLASIEEWLLKVQAVKEKKLTLAPGESLAYDGLHVLGPEDPNAREGITPDLGLLAVQLHLKAVLTALEKTPNSPEPQEKRAILRYIQETWNHIVGVRAAFRDLSKLEDALSKAKTPDEKTSIQSAISKQSEQVIDAAYTELNVAVQREYFLRGRMVAIQNIEDSHKIKLETVKK